MSLQKSGNSNSPRKASVGVPGPRAVSKSRTSSEVSILRSPRSPQYPYDQKRHSDRHSFSSKLLTQVVVQHDPINDSKPGYKKPGRRFSHDAAGKARSYLIQVDETRRALLKNEDSDGNKQITIEDHGPKTIALGTAPSGGYKKFEVRGNYMISNLLQELTLAHRAGRSTIVLEEARLNENPVNRLSRVIKDTFWPNLTRRIDGSNIFKVAEDTKDRSGNRRPRIYVPKGAPEQYEYYKRIAAEHADKHLEVILLPDDPSDPEYVRDLNKAPGLLAIEMEPNGKTPDGKPDFRGLPFVVPGGRFNELYGWDSYMETLGLLVNDRVDLCESMVKHFCFCIKHYGKILNANRTYYLTRSQPPFLTDMATRVYDRIKHQDGSLEFLRTAILAAIKDYYGTWMSKPRLDERTGLSRYHPGGLGVPPETEASHFENKLMPYATKYGMTYEEFIEAYNYQKVSEPELDEYFRHDRSVRESGHDTTNRLDGKGAKLATVDLNSLLYKVEVDIARVIRNFFGDKLTIPDEWRAKGQPAFETSSMWDRRAKKRRQTMNKLMWSDAKGMFFDYDTEDCKQTDFESATTFWAMWAGAATPAQAEIMVEKALPRFEEHGGLASSTEASRDAEGQISLNRPNRQWDYPFGWAPQQILAWTGLLRYGFEEEAQRLAYRWLYMMTKAFCDFNGVVVEKYNVVEPVKPHKVTAEYGNQGADFEGAPTEGFGWVNASYVYGLQIVNSHMKRALGTVATWDTFQKMAQAENPAEEQKILMEARRKEAKAEMKAAHEAQEAHEA